MKSADEVATMYDEAVKHWAAATIVPGLWWSIENAFAKVWTLAEVLQYDTKRVMDDMAHAQQWAREHVAEPN